LNFEKNEDIMIMVTIINAAGPPAPLITVWMIDFGDLSPLAPIIDIIPPTSDFGWVDVVWREHLPHTSPSYNQRDSRFVHSIGKISFSFRMQLFLFQLFCSILIGNPKASKDSKFHNLSQNHVLIINS
jgi:hypothetical protein